MQSFRRTTAERESDIVIHLNLINRLSHPPRRRPHQLSSHIGSYRQAVAAITGNAYAEQSVRLSTRDSARSQSAQKRKTCEKASASPPPPPRLGRAGRRKRPIGVKSSGTHLHHIVIRREWAARSGAARRKSPRLAHGRGKQRLRCLHASSSRATLWRHWPMEALAKHI